MSMTSKRANNVNIWMKFIGKPTIKIGKHLHGSSIKVKRFRSYAADRIDNHNVHGLSSVHSFTVLCKNLTVWSIWSNKEDDFSMSNCEKFVRIHVFSQSIDLICWLTRVLKTSYLDFGEIKKYYHYFDLGKFWVRLARRATNRLGLA